MAGTHLTCTSSLTEKRQAVREAGDRLAQLMASLDASDSAALQATISQMFAALRGLSPLERMSAVDYAEAVEHEAES